MTRRLSFTLLATHLATLLAACGAAAPSSPPLAPSPSSAQSSGRASAQASSPAAGGDSVRPAQRRAAEILEAAITATGGRDAKRAMVALQGRGRARLVQLGLTGEVTWLWAAPRRMKTTLELGRLGTVANGTDGQVVWDQGPMQAPRRIVGDEAARRLREATFHGELDWKELWSKVEVTGATTIDGAAADTVVATAADGQTMTLHFSRDSKLLVATEAEVEGPAGRVRARTTFHDYRVVGAVRLPFRTVVEQGPVTVELSFDELTPNPTLAADAFALPPGV